MTVLFIVGILFHFLVPLIAPGIPPQFLNLALFRPWEGWTSIYMIVHPLWFGLVFAALYLALQSRRVLPSGWRGGMVYGLGVFLVGALPVWALVYAALQVPANVMASFVIQSACQYLTAGAALGATAQR